MLILCLIFGRYAIAQASRLFHAQTLTCRENRRMANHEQPVTCQHNRWKTIATD